jgi:hyperosmotically inducible periplasmic protein
VSKLSDGTHGAGVIHRAGRIQGALLAAVMLAAAATGTAGLAQSKSAFDNTNIVREVRHELVQIPWYSVFDNLSYTVEGSVVTLNGQVRDGNIKDEAGSAVKGIPGVTKVVNNIEILPASPMDNQIRTALYRAIYNEPELQRYAEGILRNIHIIVNQGHVTLEGTVDNQTDKNLAYLRANGVPDVFSVTNNLQVQTSH